MERKKTAFNFLNRLIRLHEDRIEGFKHAIEHLGEEDSDLNIHFLGFIEQSHMHQNTLKERLMEVEGTPTEGTTLPGELSHLWMDFKSNLASNPRKSILQSCLQGEERMQKEYLKILEDPKLDREDRELLEQQRMNLAISYERISSILEEEGA